MTFVFTNQVDGKLVPVEPISPKLQQKEPHKEFLKPKQNVEQKFTRFALHDKLQRRSASVIASASCSSSNAWTKEALHSVRITKNISMNVALKTDHSLPNEVSRQKRSCPADTNNEHSLVNDVSQQKRSCFVKGNVI